MRDTVKVKKKTVRTCVCVCLPFFPARLIKAPGLEMPHAEVVNFTQGSFFKVNGLLLSASLPPTVLHLYLSDVSFRVCPSICSFCLCDFSPRSRRVFQSSSICPPADTRSHARIRAPPPSLFLRGVDQSGSRLVYVHELNDTLAAAALHRPGATKAR